MPETTKILYDRTLALLLCAMLGLGACSTESAPAPEASAPSAASIDSTFSAVVGVFADIPADARTADVLGLRRQGSGVLIDNDGLILTIGYLIMEAAEIIVVGPEGNQIPAEPVAYDHATGFGLIRARKPLAAKPLKLGSSKLLSEGARVLAVSYSGRTPVVAAHVVSRRWFAGSWEYLLENAIFTTPPHHEFGGAALIDSNGELVGIGSLMVNDAIVRERPVIGNMFVPIDSLKPILADLIAGGRRKPPVPPWLGVYTDEARGRVYITRLTKGGPAEQAGLRKGDIIIGVGGKRVGTMIEFFRKIRIQGSAGARVQLDILPAAAQDLMIKKINVKSLDRYDWLHNESDQ
jgi:S1-C subfamily serine protease